MSYGPQLTHLFYPRMHAVAVAARDTSAVRPKAVSVLWLPADASIHMCMHWQSLPEIRRLRIDVRRAGTSCPAPHVIRDLRGRQQCQQHWAQGARQFQIEQQRFTPGRDQTDDLQRVRLTS